MTLTITSTAFPNVAFSRPAKESLWMDSPNSSVAKASTEANGMIPKKLKQKLTVAPQCNLSAKIPRGTKTRSQLIGEEANDSQNVFFTLPVKPDEFGADRSRCCLRSAVDSETMIRRDKWERSMQNWPKFGEEPTRKEPTRNQKRIGCNQWL